MRHVIGTSDRPRLIKNEGMPEEKLNLVSHDLIGFAWDMYVYVYTLIKSSYVIC